MMHDRKNIRLPHYDYGAAGWYFVTICTRGRECFFGQIEHNVMRHSPIGDQANVFWNEIPQHFPTAELGEFVVMPNHVHGIIGIHHAKSVPVNTGDSRRDVACNVPTCNIPTNLPCDDNRIKNEYMSAISPKPGTLSAMMRSYKSAVTKWCHDNHFPHFGWQSRFHDHIIRNQEEFDRIEKYIQENIANWKDDRFWCA